MSYHQDGGPTLIVMKDHDAWITYDGDELKIIHIRHIFGNVQKPSLGVESFRWGTEVTRFCQSSNGGGGVAQI